MPILAEIVEVLRKVHFLESLDDFALEGLAADCTVMNYGRGEALISELETGDDVVIVLEGRAKVTVGGFSGTTATVVGEIGPGDAVGEMAMFTGELRSATVIATEPMKVLSVDGDLFDGLMQRHPEVARYFANLLADRLRVHERTLAEILNPDTAVERRMQALQKTKEGGGGASHGPLRSVVMAVYRELVLSRKRDLAFVLLLSFIASLLIARGVIFLVRWSDFGLEPFLYVTRIGGVILLCVSGFGALVFFRPVIRRALAVGLGTGLALLFEQPAVWLAFDIFYEDTTTPDPDLMFNVETLYDRAEGSDLAMIAVVGLIQFVYLRHFYFRILMVLGARIARRLRPGVKAKKKASRSLSG